MSSSIAGLRVSVCSGPYTDTHTHTHTHTAEARSFWNISTVSVARECETEN